MSLLCFNSTKRRSSSMDAEESVTKNEIPEGMRPEAKIAGYLDKRGRRLPTWKRYWFVLDGPLLLYFQSEEDYLNLSPCKGSLNIGLVVSVRPSGSRSSPQLILVTRAHPVHLRAKESKDQERWLKGLLDSIVQFSRAAEPSMVNSLRRYEDACLPEQPEVVSTMERVRRMGQQALMPPDQLLNASKSLRKVAPSIPSQANNNDDSVCAITAKLPTNSAVHRMLEKRQEDKKVEEEEQKEQRKKSSEEEVKKEAETGMKENQEENKEEKSECENKKEESTVEINEEIAEKKEDVVKTVAEVVKVPVEYSVVVKDRKSKIDPIQKPEEKPKEDVKEPAPSVKVEDVEDEDAGYDLINKDYQIEGDYEAIEQSEEEDIYAMPSADEEKDEAEDEPVVPPRPQQETFHATPVVILESSPEPDYEYSETMFSVEWTEPEPPPRPIEIHNQVERTFSADELDVLLSKTSSEVAPIMTRLSLDTLNEKEDLVRATPCVAGSESRVERAQRAAHAWTLDLPDVVPPKEQSDDESESDTPNMSLEEAMQVIRRASRRLPKVTQAKQDLHEAVVARVMVEDDKLESLEGPIKPIDSKRLSFATTDLELTLEETVDTLKTPFVSATFG